MGDDIPIREIRIIKDSAEDAFRHEMLREHTFDFCLGEVWVDCVSALLMEVRERLAEGRRVLTFGLDERLQFRAEFGDGILKGIDSGIPFGEILLGVGEEGLEQMDEVLPLGDVQIEDKCAVLVENGAMRGLEDDVFGGIPRCQLLLCFGGQIVQQIFRLPVAEDESEFRDDFTIDADVVSVGGGARLFADEGEARVGLRSVATGFGRRRGRLLRVVRRVWQAA